MKTRWFVALLAAVTVVGMSPDLSQAKRLGGGKSVGMQRQAPAPTPPAPTPATPAPATPAAPVAGKPAVPATAAAAAAAPAKRSWMGPLAGLAAGLGLAALFSALGMGEGFANFVMLLLLGLVAFIAIRFIMARFANKGGAQPALAGAGAGTGAATSGVSATPWSVQQPTPAAAPISTERSSFEPAATAAPVAGQDVSVTGAPLRPITIGEKLGTPAAVAAAAGTGTPAALTLPEGFDLPAFERVAKMIFIRLQSAHDAGDLNDLREFTTPEMFAAVRLEIQERNGAIQHTDVERVDAQLVDFVQESERQIASVRFQGLVREDAGSAATPFDEVWHLVKPQDGSRSWAIAGIQQPQ